MKNLKGRKLNKSEQKNINGGGVDCSYITCPPGYYCGQRGCTRIIDEPGDPDPVQNPGSGSSNGGGGGGSTDYEHGIPHAQHIQ